MSRFCVIEGTKITLNNKETLPIEKIKAGQEILSFNLNTLQKSQKNDTLLKLSTDIFDGVFQEDLIKSSDFISLREIASKVSSILAVYWRFTISVKYLSRNCTTA